MKVAIAAPLILFAASTIIAKADTISYTFSAGPQPAGAMFEGGTGFGDGRTQTDYGYVSGAEAFSGFFDPSLGTLNSISFSLTSSVTISGAAKWDPFPVPGYTGPGSAGVGISSTLVLKNGNNNQTIFSQNGGGGGTTVQVYMTDPAPGVVPLPTVTFSGTASAVFTDPSILAQFMDTQPGSPYYLRVENDMQAIVNTDFADSEGTTVVASLDWSWTYNFTPVPEPKILLIFTGGLVSLVVRRMFTIPLPLRETTFFESKRHACNCISAPDYRQLKRLA
jgi:hypothetical protein